MTNKSRIGATVPLPAYVIPLLLVAQASIQAEDISFNEQIRPILAEHCLQCHGPDAEKREADLRLDVEADAKKDAIVPLQPKQSPLYQRITSGDPDLRMPPPASGKRLSKQQTELIQAWIQSGAKYQGHWAFEPIQDPTPPDAEPESDDINRPTTDIDRFVISRLKQHGLELAKPITRQQLIRRATFDLTGLPPTWDEVVAFERDSSADAYPKVIDRLLKSPRYGERWGRHWLDIARYADTHGGSAIGFVRFPFSYTYRDYVINAFDADVTFDRFVTEQLAADQLGLAENDPALAGLGFLTVGMQYRNPHDTIDDQIDVVTRGLLGLTVTCARCHDHKYDAIPTTDYYSLYATLASSSPPDLPPVIGQPAATKPLMDYQRELAKRQTRFGDMGREQSEVMRSRLRMQVGLYLRELAKGTPEQDLASAFLSYRTDDLRPHVLNRWRDYLAKMSADDPVLGPWVRLTKVASEKAAARNSEPPALAAGVPTSKAVVQPAASADGSQDTFTKHCMQLVSQLKQENGDPSKFPPMNKLSSNGPRWNPRVLDAIETKKPKSMLDVADAYGELFADVQRQWLTSLLAMTLEASTGGKVVPDEDAKHTAINSPVNRQLRHHLHQPGTPTAMSDELAGEKLLNRTVRDALRGRKNSIHDLNLKSPGSPPRAMSLRETPQPGDFHVFKRGSAIARGARVQPRFLTALSGKDAQAFPNGERRLGLARAIIDPANPLTRRVIVNWVWQHHFGRGLVRTPDDFGTRGQPPTHPKLLDYLASRLLEDGWSLKKLHRRIMLSRVYQQAATERADARIADSDNRLLWRMPRRRLEMEAMRDSMLAVSGELDETRGGRPFEFTAKPIVPRRSVYAFVNRDIVSGLASTFDGANPSSCTAKRPETTVPQQTLFALNSAFIQDRAAALARHNQVQAAGSDEERIRVLYRRAYSRSPTQREIDLAVGYVQSQRNLKQSAKAQTSVWQRLSHVLLATNEFVFVD